MRPNPYAQALLLDSNDNAQPTEARLVRAVRPAAANNQRRLRFSPRKQNGQPNPTYRNPPRPVT